MLTIYIDMDGVVCDWYGAMGGRPFDKEWFHSFIDSGGFETLPSLGSVRSLQEMIEAGNGCPIHFSFLSSVGGVSGGRRDLVYQQKRAWLNKNGFDHVPLICVHHKGLKKRFATPTAILIDDTESNCNDFTEAGGHSVKINKTEGYKDIHTLDVMSHVAKIIKMYETGVYAEDSLETTSSE